MAGETPPARRRDQGVPKVRDSRQSARLAAWQPRAPAATSSTSPPASSSAASA